MMSVRHERVFKSLSAVASDVTGFGSSRLAAAVVLKGDIVSIGTNKRKTHPFQKQYSKNCHSIFLHAEISAIRNALRVLNADDLKKATLYVCRMAYDNKHSQKMSMANACPCPGCMRAIVEFGFKDVIYSIDNGWKSLNEKHSKN